jgi:hypothetical protein
MILLPYRRTFDLGQNEPPASMTSDDTCSPITRHDDPQ